MDWFKNLEMRRGRVLFALFLIIFATLAVASMRDPRSYDSFWHLKMGQDWVEQGLSPFVDHYSFTQHGEEIHMPPYPFEVLYYKFVDVLGLGAGYKIMLFVALSLVVVFMALWLRLLRAPLVVYLPALAMLAVLVLDRANVRPELFAYPLLIFSLILYEKTRANPGSKYFLVIALTMLVFTNYHSSSVLGYVIFFGLFVDLGIDQLREKAPMRRWLSWAAWGAGIVAVGFVNPHGVHPVIRRLTFPQEWFSLIQEYQSPWQGDEGVMAFCLLLVAGATVLMLFRQRLYGYAVVCLIFSWYASQIVRMTVPAGIVVLCLFTLVLSRLDLHSLMMRESKARRAAVATAWGLLFVVPLLIGVHTARMRVMSNLSLLGYFPDQLVEYMKYSGMEGRVFNDYGIGGYLIYHLAPDVRVYIDGRTGILYPVEHFRQWLAATEDANVLATELEKFDIDYVVLSNRQEHIELMGDIPELELDYSDLRYSLYTRENANFPLAGELWSRPWCWDDDHGAGVQAEWQNALFLVPKYSLLVPILGFASGYAGSEDKAAFLQSSLENDRESWSDATLRIAAFRSMELELHDLALDFFAMLGEPSLMDVLAMGLASMRLERLDQAEQMLHIGIRLAREGAESNEYAILHALITELQTQRPVEQISRADLDTLSWIIEQQSILPPETPVQVHSFCRLSDVQSAMH